MKSEAQFLKKKLWSLPVLESFVGYKTNLGVDSIIGPIHVHLAMFKVYPIK
jgi:hypothetical protein